MLFFGVMHTTYCFLTLWTSINVVIIILSLSATKKILFLFQESHLFLSFDKITTRSQWKWAMRWPWFVLLTGRSSFAVLELQKEKFMSFRKMSSKLQNSHSFCVNVVFFWWKIFSLLVTTGSRCLQVPPMTAASRLLTCRMRTTASGSAQLLQETRWENFILQHFDWKFYLNFVFFFEEWSLDQRVVLH